MTGGSNGVEYPLIGKINFSYAMICCDFQETWTSTLKAAQSRWSEAVALELAAETEKMSAFQNVNEGEVEQDTGPKSPDDTVMSQTQMLSYYKPIESKC